MSNAFKKIEPKDNLPKRVKKETLSNIFSLKLIMDIVDLFVVKGASSLSQAISGESHVQEGKYHRDNSNQQPSEGR